MKKNIKLIILIIFVIIISGVVVFFYFNQPSKNSNTKKDVSENANNKKEAKKDIIVSTTDVYKCYRHNNEDYTSENVTYKYTKYYQFSVLENKIKSTDGLLVYVYKFNTLEEYKAFDINSIFSNSYKIENDDKNYTYQVSSNIRITPSGERNLEYTLEEYLELLKQQGYGNCEKQQ